ncbi:MAG: GNAT family N-acetyltransferase [Tannerella sp.]|jgi:phosphinothricin acetyltransferase|nr:GNAT family N-acetyltransferase [Tannerella sp.]
MTDKKRLRNAKPEDAAGIAGIYNYYVENTDITFETEPVPETEMQNRIRTVSEQYPYLVYEETGRILGYCYASTWKKREAYRHTVESAVYVDRASQGRGIGALLLNALIEALRQTSVHAVIACITMPNPQSVKLHEKFGFRQASGFKEVGHKFGKWIDVADWQLLLP